MRLSGVLLVLGATLATACYDLSDPQSPMNQAMHGAFAKSTIEIPKLSSNYSLCLGSLDANAVVLGLMSLLTTEPTCLQSMADMMPLLTRKKSIDGSHSHERFHAEDGNDQISWNGTRMLAYEAFMFDKAQFEAMMNTTNAQSVIYCGKMNNVFACMKQAVIPFLMAKLSNEQCCANALNQIVLNYGAPFDQFIVALLIDISNVFCSTQSPGFDGQSNQTCAYAFFQSIVHSSSSPHRLIKFAAQVPTSETCSVLVSNSPYSFISGRTPTTLFTAPYMPTSCFKPLDALLTRISQWPLIQSSQWGAYFTTGVCRATKCYRIPTNFSSTCSYTTSLQLLSSPALPSPTNNSAQLAALRASGSVSLSAFFFLSLVTAIVL